MMHRVERQAPLLLSRIIAQPVRHKAMHRLVQRHRDKNNDKDDNEVSDINMHFFIVPHCLPTLTLPPWQRILIQIVII